MEKAKETKAKRFQTELLLKSQALKNYQPDFARSVLTEPAYSISEAVDAVEAALRKGVK